MLIILFSWNPIYPNTRSANFKKFNGFKLTLNVGRAHLATTTTNGSYKLFRLFPTFDILAVLVFKEPPHRKVQKYFVFYNNCGIKKLKHQK